MARFGLTDEQNRGIDEGVARIGVSDQQRQQMVDQLLRSVGSLNAQTLNRFSDFAGGQGLPAATQLAQQRGIALQGQQQVQQGQFGIEQYANDANRQAYLALAQMMQQRVMSDKDRKAQQDAALLGQIGQGAGFGAFIASGGASGSPSPGGIQ